jgi:hypothetical protein
MEAILADRSERLVVLTKELVRADSNKAAAAARKKIRQVRKTMNLMTEGILSARRNEVERRFRSLEETSNALLRVHLDSRDKVTEDATEVTEAEVDAMMKKILGA